MNDDWYTNAACRDVDPDLFFTEKQESVNTALLSCHYCPVRMECLSAADREEKDTSLYFLYGVRGGLTPRQRYKRRMRNGMIKPKQKRSRPKPLDYGPRRSEVVIDLDNWEE